MKLVDYFFRFLTLFLLLSTFFPALSFANSTNPPYNKLIFFGDSLSDNGNLYQMLSKIIPQSPPYYQGRFSNGATWAEIVGNQFKKNYAINYKIYAVAGATAAPVILNVNTLDLQINKYLYESRTVKKSNTLYFIWIGANDYLYDMISDTNYLTNKVTRSIFWSLEMLISRGGEHFVILNLPDLSKTPLINVLGTGARLHKVSLLHNMKLSKIINELAASYPHTTFYYIDTYAELKNFTEHLNQSNEKHQSKIRNTTEACFWRLFLPLLSEVSLRKDLANHLALKSSLTNKTSMIEYVLQSPILSQTITLTSHYKNGFVKPCYTPDDYLFWDFIHPTAVGHKILARVVIERLQA